jgi:hypothetical protein
MPTASPLVAELKRALKERQLTYAQVARALGLSEASIKRQFASGRFSLERVEQICAFAKLELSELAERARRRATPTTKLSLEQEREVVADPKLFLITWLVLNRTPFEQVVRDYGLTPREVGRYLIRLDRLRVIDLLPANRFRLLVDRHFTWRTDGPVQAYLFEKLLREFFSARFEHAPDEFFFHGGAISEGAHAQLKRALRNAANDCVDIIERDRGVPAKRSGAAFVIALRPWTYSGFSRFLRAG